MLSRFSFLRRSLAAATLAAGALLALPSTAAQARVFVGFGFGFPVFAPYYPFYPFYAPWVAFAPPPVVYAPPPSAAGPAGRCFAGAYVCPPDRPGPVGAPCSCPTNTGRAAGRIG